MSPIRRAVPQALAGALCVLLATMAILQYRWIGQVNEAALERMLRAVQNSAAQFRVEVDRELGRAFLSLQFGEFSTLTADDADARYADRFSTWLRTAQHPALIGAVYFVNLAPGAGDVERGEPAIRRWDMEARALVPVDWDDTPLRRVRDRVARLLRTAQFESGAALDLDGPVITGPLRVLATASGEEAPEPGLTVLALDGDYVRQVWLPELVARHFSAAGQEAYRVAVVAPRGREVLYRTDSAAPLIEGQADAVERLFARVRVEGYLVDNWVGGVLDRLPPGISELDWELLVAHQSGSLASAVAPARVQNLATSFGVLLLLCGAVGLLIHASRLDRQHARQQLDLVAGVSHELRTPVSVIQAAAENLERGVVDGPRVQTYGATIDEQARRLGAMVEGALDFARIESRRGTTARASLAPAAVVELAIRAMEASLPPGARIERMGDPTLPAVWGDEEALATAVQNLLHNAVTYGGADGWVGVRCEAGGSSRRPEVRITVEDHGPGVDVGDQERIFEPFQRGTVATGRRPEGSGLGLALVRRIAEAHGGRVSLSSVPGSGSAFTLHLPATGVAADQ
jgi:signal transduction histidine kinase